MRTLLVPREVDRILRYPRGRSVRLARAGKLPHVRLPDGEIRFNEAEIDQLVVSSATRAPSADGEGRHGR